MLPRLVVAVSPLIVDGVVVDPLVAHALPPTDQKFAGSPAADDSTVPAAHQFLLDVCLVGIGAWLKPSGDLEAAEQASLSGDWRHVAHRAGCGWNTDGATCTIAHPRVVPRAGLSAPESVARGRRLFTSGVA